MAKTLSFQRLIGQFIGCILLITIHLTVSAQVNLVGEYKGSVAGINQSNGNAVNQSIILRITNQNGSSFDGKFILLPSEFSTNFTGSFSTNTKIDITCGPSPCISAFTDGARINIPNGDMMLSTPAGNFLLGGLLKRNKIVKPSKAPGTSLKDATTVRSEILGVVTPIQQHLVKTLRADVKTFNFNPQGFLLEGESGLNSGDLQLGNLGVWLSYNYRDIENDFSGTAFESTSHTAIGGVDYSPNDYIVLGVAIAYEYSDTDTLFNQGNLQTDGITIAPYFGFLLNETWSLDASFGISLIENDQFRTDPTTALRVTSNPDTDRFFMAMNFNGTSYINNWIIGGRIGYLFAKSVTDEFVESDTSTVGKTKTKLGQIRLGADVAYNFGNWEPFLSTTYQYDYEFDKVILLDDLQPANDRDDILLATGFRYYNDNGFTSNFEYSKRLLREEYNEDSLSFTLRYDF